MSEKKINQIENTEQMSIHLILNNEILKKLAEIDLKKKLEISIRKRKMELTNLKLADNTNNDEGKSNLTISIEQMWES